MYGMPFLHLFEIGEGEPSRIEGVARRQEWEPKVSYWVLHHISWNICAKQGHVIEEKFLKWKHISYNI